LFPHYGIDRHRPVPMLTGSGARPKEKDGKEVTLYYYDEASRLLQVTDPLGQITCYTYDGDGKRVSMTDARGKTIFIYDGSEASGTYPDTMRRDLLGHASFAQPTTSLVPPGFGK
jgi:YD repeat-containing protein